MIDRVGSELRRELDRLGDSPTADLAAFTAAWPRLAGETVARNAWPARLGPDGTLHVAASSATWAFELTRLAPTLLERFREELGQRSPAALRFAPGALPSSPEERAATVPAPAEASPEERRAAASLAAAIDDENLRELVARAAAASLARARSDRRF